jgi:hypothetical protein
MNESEVIMRNAKTKYEFIVHKAHTALKRFDEVRAMIWRLLHPNPEMR